MLCDLAIVCQTSNQDSTRLNNFHPKWEIPHKNTISDEYNKKESLLFHIVHQVLEPSRLWVDTDFRVVLSGDSVEMQRDKKKKKKERNVLMLEKFPLWMSENTDVMGGFKCAPIQRHWQQQALE